MRNKTLLRVLAVGITAVMCTLVVLSAVFPIPSSIAGTNFLSIGTSYKVLANPDWLSGYSYRKQITIDGSTAGAQTNYQMQLKVAKSAFEQIDYGESQKYGSNPVLEPSASGWDDDKLTDFVFMVDDDGEAVQESGNYILYYNGGDGTNWKIGRATSSDGYTWSKYGSNPVLGLGSGGSFDDTHVAIAAVIKHGASDYEMFYLGVISSGEGKLGRATSTDGLSWTKDTGNNPLVDKTTWTNVYASGFRVPHVMLASNTNYYFFFEAEETTEAGVFKIWAGSSSDGISWSSLNSGAPVFEPAASGWDDGDVANPRVVEIENGKYLLGYNGASGDIHSNDYQLGFATSTDLVSWARRPENPLVELGVATAWDDYRIECFVILKQDIGESDLRFWYYGCPDIIKTDASIGYGWIPQAVAYTGGHCQDDFDDIRFTRSDGSTELDHWREEYTSGVAATFWVEFNSIAASPSSSTFYIYYDYSGGSSGSNGANTFITFDDFERGIDGAEVDGSWTEASGTVEISTGQAYGGTRSMKLVGAATEARASIPQTAGSGYAIRYRAYKEDLPALRLYHDDGTNMIQVCIGGAEDIEYYTTAYQDTGANAVADTWELYELNDIDFATNQNYDIWHQGAEIQADAGMRSATGAANVIMFFGQTQVGQDSWIDDFIIRNWCSPEPTWGTWGSEEGINPEITNTPSTNNFGILEVNTTSNTAINYFTITNTGNCNVDVTIQGTDVTGGDDMWTLSDTATPGENIYGLYAGLDDADDLFDVIVKKTATYNTLVSNLAESGTQDWGLKIYMPTSVTNYDAQQMTGTITLVASASS